MHPSRILTLGIIGFTSGVFLRSFFNIDWYGVLFALLLGLVSLALARIHRTSVAVFVFGVVLSSSALGIARYHMLDVSADTAMLSGCVGEQCTLDAVVVAEPDVRDTGTRLTLEVVGEDGMRFTRSRILASVERYPEYRYGDKVRFTGELALPEAFASDDTGRTFDYPAYLRKDGISYQAFRPSLEKTADGMGNPLRAGILRIKETFLAGLTRALPEPESSLAGGLIVGAKRALGETLLNDFRATGIVHLVVLSGYNVTIVAEAAMRALAFLPVALGSFVGAFGIIAFAVMTGAGATVVRASLMALLVILARRIGRPHAMERGLMIAGVAMIAHNPFILVFDSSFQLSFLATLALVLVVPIFKLYLARVPERFGLREIIATTAGVQLFVLPFILWLMGDLSLVALPVNLLILGVVPAAMLFGFVGGIAGMWGSMFGVVVSVPAYVVLAYMLGVVDMFARLPFAVVHIPAFSFWIVVLVYLAYGYAIYLFRKKKRERENLDRADGCSVAGGKCIGDKIFL